MNRRNMLKRIGGVGLFAAGVGTVTASNAAAASASEPCIICQVDECKCPDGCIVAHCPPVEE